MKKLLLALVMWFALAGVGLAAVNINTATKEQLVSLKGVGEKRAQEIIDYRTKNGPFKTVDDLEKVQGIGPGIMKQIRSQISVSGSTTVDKAPAKTAVKKTEPAKGDAMKADKAKEKVAEKAKSDEKAKAAKTTDTKDEKKAATK